MKACDLRQGEACNDIAVEYARGNNVPADPKKAAEYYLRACDDLHYGMSCGNVGLHYERGDWFPKDEKKGNAYYALGCKYGEGRSCKYLAISMRDGTGMQVDNAGAAKMFDKACDMGENDACDKLIEMYMAGKAGSPQEALDLERRQCDAGRADACNAAGMLLEQGAGTVARNELQAAVLFQKACEKRSATGCVNLGDMYSEGRGLGKDDDKALSFYELACGIDGARGCGLAAKTIFGRRTPSADDVAHAVDLARRGCQKKDGVSCAVLASAYESGKPPTVARDFVRAFASYDDACDAGAADGCMKAAQMLERGLGTTRDMTRARNRYTMACLRRDAKGCAATAAFYLRGDGGAQADPSRAKILYGRACALGDKPSCARAEAIR